MSNTPTDREDLKRFIPTDLAPKAGEFVNGPLWAAFKRALLARQPEDPATGDEPHVAAAKAFKNNGWRDCVEALESLPFETPVIQEPLIPVSLTNTED